MRFFSNKFFLLGVVVFLLLTIPLTIFFIKKQQDVRTKAAASTTLSLSPASKSAIVGQNFDLDVMVNPGGTNVISFIELHMTFDATKLEALQVIPNSTAFPATLEAPVITPGNMSVSLGIGSDPTGGIQTATKVVTLSFRPLSPTTEPTKVSFDRLKTKVLSLSTDDQPGENVLISASDASVTITGAGAGGGTPTPTLQGGSPTPTSGVGTGPTPTPTQTGATSTPTPGSQTPLQPTPTPAAIIGSPGNIPPVCNSLSPSPAASGPAPLAVQFTGRGSDQDGTMTKATFNFGDGRLQDVISGMGQKIATATASRTYQTAGSFTASVIFTDDKNGVSSPCTQVITVSGLGGTPGVSPGVTSSFTSASGSPTLGAPGTTNLSLGLLVGVGIFITLGVFLLLL